MPPTSWRCRKSTTRPQRRREPVRDSAGSAAAITASARRRSAPPTANMARRCSAAGRCSRATICDISFPEREPRRAIRCEIATPAGPLRVIATHLGLSFGERRSQARALLEPDRRKRHDDGRARRLQRLVLGRLGARACWLASCRAARGFRTFPSLCPLLHLDRIYCRPREALLRWRTDPSARAISDHLPVIADVRVRP